MTDPLDRVLKLVAEGKLSADDAARMEILRALERGDITVAEATDKLGRLDGVLR